MCDLHLRCIFFRCADILIFLNAREIYTKKKNVPIQTYRLWTEKVDDYCPLSRTFKKKPIDFSAVPSIVQRPADTHVSTGNNAVFECGVRGNPSPTIFWSLQNDDTILFPRESWNEFHAEDTKDSVSTLVVHVRFFSVFFFSCEHFADQSKNVRAQKFWTAD